MAFAIAMASAPAAAQTVMRALPLAPLVLNDAHPVIDAWPAVTLRFDPDARLSLEQAVTAMGGFEVPQTAYATLGLRKKVAWLRVPLVVPPSSDGEWILDFDYTLLNRIEVDVISNGVAVQHAVLGNTQFFMDRPIRSRTHSVLLELKPGSYDLMLRVETQGSMILPMSLSKISAFHNRAINEQMLQGLLSSLPVCLLLYSLLQWIGMREMLYGKYALLILGSGLFSVHFFGIGQQYLWTDSLWLERHMAGLTSLVAACGTALFIEDVLKSDMSVRLRKAMKIGAGLLAFAAVLHAADVIDIYAVSIVMSTLGLMPALMGIPGAIARLRRGDNVGTYFLLAWTGYFLVSAVMVGVVRGSIGANFWTMHAFEFGATFDMLIFMRIAVLRSAAMHVAAQRATLERDNLHSLAHTDPLTGLLNRRGLNTTLAAALHNCNPENLLAVYMLDLDGFKPVNDQFGHDVGDEMLAVVAQRLRATVRNGDVVARVGGDEFVVMAGGLKSDYQAQELGAKLLAIFREPFSLGVEKCSVGATIGYVLAPLDGHDAVDLLKFADAAMYAGKQGGKNTLRRANAATFVAGAAEANPAKAASAA
ncbi:MAG: diguanylate cyclase [Betaproteobacteria bacterium]